MFEIFLTLLLSLILFAPLLSLVFIKALRSKKQIADNINDGDYEYIVTQQYKFKRFEVDTVKSQQSSDKIKVYYIYGCDDEIEQGIPYPTYKKFIGKYGRGYLVNINKLVKNLGSEEFEIYYIPCLDEYKAFEDEDDLIDRLGNTDNSPIFYGMIFVSAIISIFVSFIIFTNFHIPYVKTGEFPIEVEFSSTGSSNSGSSINSNKNKIYK